jgi:hypothetical protein
MAGHSPSKTGVNALMCRASRLDGHSLRDRDHRNKSGGDGCECVASRSARIIWSAPGTPASLSHPQENEGMERREAHRRYPRLRGVGRALRSARSPHGAPLAAARCTRQLWSGPRDRDTGTAPPIKAAVAGPYLRAPRVRLVVAEGRDSRTTRGSCLRGTDAGAAPAPPQRTPLEAPLVSG